MIRILKDNGIGIKSAIEKLQMSFSFPEGFPNINKKTLRHYDFEEVYDYSLEFFENSDENLKGLINYLNDNLTSKVRFTYRLKTRDSLKKKWEKYLVFGKKFYKGCNDLLGIRFIIDASKEELSAMIKNFENDGNCEIINFYEKNKINDDGYRGIHVYFRYNRNSFPIEIQFWTRKDALLHFYTHEVIYKSDPENEVFWEYSGKLRQWLETIPVPPKDIEIDYINYLYDILNKDE